ncbi:FlaD/FlaE family flagellar protein [Methanocaldococcus sp. 10A]
MIQKTVNEISSIPILPDEEFLTEDEIEEYLDNLKSKLPSFVIILLKNNLRGKRVTKKQLDKIIERITEVLSKGREDKTEELNKKLQKLEQKLDTIMKLTTVAVSNKLSEEIEKTEVEESVEEVKKEEEDVEKTIQIEEKEVIEKTEEVTKGETKKDKVEEKEKKSEVELSEGEKSMISTSEEERQYRLNDIPEDAVSMALVFKWLEFLISKVGIANLPDILDYYNKIGWISNKVILKLLRFTKNMRIILDIENIRPRDKLSPSDHIMSLLYIEKLAGRPIDTEILEMLEIEIRRIKKWAEELQSI